MGGVRALVITGGYAPPADRIVISGSDLLVVAADGGLDAARRYGLRPDAIVGDMDSVSSPELLSEYPDAEIQRYDRGKDETDTEIALEYARRAGSDRTILIGGGGGRLDHLLSVISLFERPSHPALWLTERDRVVPICESLEFDRPVDGLVSFFPVGGRTVRARSRGLRWPLDGLTWERGDFGVSNECEEERCRVEVLSGRLLMVHALPLRVEIR